MSSFEPRALVSEPVFEPAPVAGGQGGAAATFRRIGPDGRVLDLPAGVGQESASQAEEVETFSREELDARVAEAHARALEEARNEARAHEALTGALEAAVDACGKDARVAKAQLRRLAIELGAEIASHWVGAHFEAHPEAFGRAIDTALAEWPDAEPCRLRVHPADHEALLREAGGAVAASAASGALELEADASLSRGSFRVEGRAASIDGRRESVRRRLVEHLESELGADDPADTSADAPEGDA